MADTMVRAPVQPSYHDVVVYARGKRYRLFDCGYGLKLECCRVAGWQLWDMTKNGGELIGGEYADDDFRIEIQGVIICGKTGAAGETATAGGWDGRVSNA